MPLAHEVALELRKLAASLMQEAEQELTQVDVCFCCKYNGEKGKPMFLALARILPHPLKKGPQEYDETGLQITYESEPIKIRATIERSAVCKLIEPARKIPAVYECEPLLSAEEEDSLTEA